MQIRESIEIAKERERKSGRLQTYIEAKIPAMHRSIRLPENGATQQLLTFITHYIEHVPDFLQALAAHCEQAKLGEFTDVCIKIIEDFFISPPELISQHEDLHALIDEAYLAHRMIEELNDRLMLLCGAPLVPMDMTLSNIIVHDLIGEEFANELDLAVLFSIEMMFNGEAFTLDELTRKSLTDQNQNWETVLAQWPCLAGDSSISLTLFDDPQHTSANRSFEELEEVAQSQAQRVFH